ncbi:MAG: glutamine--fructose-6-phosphate transaminase (isomerizing) [Deltaproteobacteria bacterium]|nr:glutamine--fructose-6-phosphate transaminase (isomerizing) [Deltaproteobacteria bacterium]
MCGIIGVMSDRRVESYLMTALERMEYRGYDSAGVVTLSARGSQVRRAQGPLQNLTNLLSQAPTVGNVGLGHTRWATHGGPNVDNAHPHVAGTLALVHNGIIENANEIRHRLCEEGVELRSETDSELVVQLLLRRANEQPLSLDVIQEVCGMLKGSWAFVVVDEGVQDALFFAKNKSPLLLCRKENGRTWISSDASAFDEKAPLVHFLDDGSVGVIKEKSVRLRNRDNIGCTISFRPLMLQDEDVDVPSPKNHPSFMRKEMFEQPSILLHLAHHFAEEKTISKACAFSPVEVTNVHFVACGSSYYAAQTAASALEAQGQLPVKVSLASEFRYSRPYLTENSLVVGISQSGETADTLAALELANLRGAHVLVVTNVLHSTMAKLGQESAGVLPLLAGREVGVASTKAFSAQVAVLHVFSLWFVRQRGASTSWNVLETLQRASWELDGALIQLPLIEQKAAELAIAAPMICLGRGALYPIALEGMLKMKELTYLRAEAFAAGELKHGPLALVTAGTPVIALLDDTEAGQKCMLALEEVQARGAEVWAFVPAGHPASEQFSCVELFASNPLSYSLQANLLLQFLAYLIAQQLGHDVDRPRNLAKSVTVE